MILLVLLLLHEWNTVGIYIDAENGAGLFSCIRLREWIWTKDTFIINFL